MRFTLRLFLLRNLFGLLSRMMTMMGKRILLAIKILKNHQIRIHNGTIKLLDLRLTALATMILSRFTFGLLFSILSTILASLRVLLSHLVALLSLV